MQNPEQCREIVRQLWPFLDGALPDEWQERVIEHLAGCDNCRSHYDFERAFLEAVRMTGATDIDLVAVRERIVRAMSATGAQAE